MNYKVIKTGSQGNAVIIKDIILVDCGVSLKSLKNHWQDLKLVLLTHIHTDHFKKSTIKALAKERPTLRFACCGWLVPSLVECGVEKRNIDILTLNAIHNYKMFKVIPFSLVHNVQNCGYKIWFENEKAIYATDTSTLQGVSAHEYDLYMVEANYTGEEMDERIAAKQESGRYAYEYEVMRNHLSKEDCDRFLFENIGNHSEIVYLHRHIEKVK